MVDIVRYMKRSVTQHFQRLFNMWVEYLSRIHRRVTTENPSRLICRWWYPTRILFPIELRVFLTIIYIIQFTFSLSVSLYLLTFPRDQPLSQIPKYVERFIDVATDHPIFFSPMLLPRILLNWSTYLFIYDRRKSNLRWS